MQETMSRSIGQRERMAAREASEVRYGSSSIHGDTSGMHWRDGEDM